MRKLLLVILPAFLFLAADCEKEPAGVSGLQLNFKSTYNEEALVMFSEAYDYPGDHEVKFQLFQYFISNITLLENSSDTEGVLLSEAELIEYKNQVTLEESEEGVNLSFDNIPVGNYSAIRFGLGVAPNLNATNPGDYRPDEPLGDHYWSAARGYVFAKIEGNADTNNDGLFSTGLTYHVGADDLYRTITFPIDLNLENLSIEELNFSVDLAEVMSGSNGTIDIFLTHNTVDHTNNPVIYETLWDNLGQALKMRN